MLYELLKSDPESLDLQVNVDLKKSILLYLRHCLDDGRAFSDEIVFLYLEHKAILFNKNIKMSSFKSSENIQKKEVGPDRSVSDNQSSSVTLNELAIKARKIL